MNRLIVDLYKPEIPKFNHDEFDSMYCDEETSRKILDPSGCMFFKFLTPEQKRKTFIIVRGYETYRYLFDLHKQGVIHIGLRNFNWNTIQALDMCWIEGVRFSFFGHLPSKPFGDVYRRWQKVMSPEVEKEPTKQPQLAYVNTIEDVKQVFDYFKNQYKGMHATDFETRGFPEYDSFENLCVSFANKVYACCVDIRDICGYDFYNTDGTEVPHSNLVWEDGQLKTLSVPTKEEVLKQREEFNTLYKNFLIDTEDRYMCFNAEFEPRCCYRQTGYFPRFLDIWAYSKAMDNISNNLKWFTQFLTYEPSWDDESEETQHLLDLIFRRWRTWEEFINDTDSDSKKFRTRQECYDFYVQDVKVKNPSATEEAIQKYAKGLADQWINIYDNRIKLSYKYWGNTWASVKMRIMGKYNCLDSFYTYYDYEEIQRQYKGKLDKSARILSNQKLNAALIRMNGIFIDECGRQEIENKAKHLQAGAFIASTGGYIHAWNSINKDRIKDFGLSNFFVELKKNYPVVFSWLSQIKSDNTFEEKRVEYSFARHIIGVIHGNYKFYAHQSSQANVEALPFADWLQNIIDSKEDFTSSVGQKVVFEYEFISKICSILIRHDVKLLGSDIVADEVNQVIRDRFLPEVDKLRSNYPTVDEFRDDVTKCLLWFRYYFMKKELQDFTFYELLDEMDANADFFEYWTEAKVFGLDKISTETFSAICDTISELSDNYWALDNPYEYCLGMLYPLIPDKWKTSFTYGEWCRKRSFDDFVERRINPIKDMKITDFNKDYYHLIGINSLDEFVALSSFYGNWSAPLVKSFYGAWFLVNFYPMIVAIKFSTLECLEVDETIEIMEEMQNDTDKFWNEYEPNTLWGCQFPIVFDGMDGLTNLFKNGLGLDNLGLKDLTFGVGLSCYETDIIYHAGFGFGFGCTMLKEISTYINGITTKSSKLIASMDDMGCTVWEDGTGGEERYDEENWY